MDTKPHPQPPRTFIVHATAASRNRRLLVPVFVPGTVDPVYSRRKRPITLGTTLLSAIITIYGFYATGNLPEADQFFLRSNALLRSSNDAVVNAVLAAMPVIGMVMFAGALVLFVLFHANRMRRTASRREFA